MNESVAVVAGVLVNQEGFFLLGSRPEGKVYAGYWEFPGGKVESGESPLQALSRELKEELGITVQQATPWLRKYFVYPHAFVELQFFRVWGWGGLSQPREGQHLCWQRPGVLTVDPMLPANGPIIKALSLPEKLYYLMPGSMAVRANHIPKGSWLIVDGNTNQNALQTSEQKVLVTEPATQTDDLFLKQMPAEGFVRPDLIEWMGMTVSYEDDLRRAIALNADFAVLTREASVDKLISLTEIPLFSYAFRADWREVGLHGYIVNV